MCLDWEVGQLSDWQGDGIVFFTFEKVSGEPLDPLPGMKRWMEEKGRWLAGLLDLGDYRGELRQAAVFYGPSEPASGEGVREGAELREPLRVVVVGLGKREKFEPDRLRQAAAVALRKCRDLRLERAALPLLALEGLPMDGQWALQEALIAGSAGLYHYRGLKTRDVVETQHPETLVVLAPHEPDDSLRTVMGYAEATVAGIFLARDLVSAPPNEATPTFLAAAARRLAEAYGFKLKILELDEARELGMGAFAAVAQGSREPACFIVLEHIPAGTEEERPVALVGKGITFDTGGISLKPGKDMDAMKHDMAGAASVLGVFEILGRMSIPRRVLGILPCTENMPDGQAYKPGDVIKTLAGLTVEVISTDAEGRMILSDGIAFAARHQPGAIIDIATLTGACVVALGKHVAGVMGNDEALVQKLQEIGMRVGERLWPLPLWDLYFDYIKSDAADFRNVGDRSGGTIIGGLFLKQFVPDDIPWAHLDIAGTAWADKDWYLAPKGATAFGVRIMAEWLRSLSR